MNYQQIADLSIKAQDVWSEGYDVLWPVLKAKKLKAGVELGVAFGGHAERILRKTDVKLYCVDPFRHIDGYIDAMNFSDPDFNKLYSYTKKRLSIFGNRAVLIRKKSKDAVKLIKENLDFVYIDADHSREGVTFDLITWFPKIREGGIISGHDYGHPNFPDVKNVVDNFFHRFNWKINVHKSGVWWVEKKPLNISYIIPAYNCSTTVEQSVKSIYENNFQSGDEVVIVNDYSSDETDSILKKLMKQYSSIKVVTLTHNHGGGAARNIAVENSKNELIFCLDSDNILENNSVSRLKQNLIESMANISSFNELRFFSDSVKDISHTWKFEETDFDIYDYLNNYQVPGASGNYLYTRNSWIKSGRYPESSGALDTWGFGLRQTCAGFGTSILPSSYYYHRAGHESYWVRESKRINTSLTATQLLIPYIDMIDSKDLDYIFGSKYRTNWFDNIGKYKFKDKNQKSMNILSILIQKIIKKLQKIGF